LNVLAIDLHDSGVLRAWKRKLNWIQSASFWKQYCYRLGVNHKSDVLRVQSCFFFTTWHCHLVAWQQNTAFLVDFAEIILTTLSSVQEKPFHF